MDSVLFWADWLSSGTYGLGSFLTGNTLIGTHRATNHPEASAMNLILVLLVLLLLFGGGGFYYGGPAYGGTGIGLIVLLAIIIFVAGGFRNRA